VKNKPLMLGFTILGFALAFAGCTDASPTAEATPCPALEPCPDCPETSCPECPPCLAPQLVTVPFEVEWITSQHNNSEGEAFRHWDQEDPPQVPENCAKCHSTPGYIDFMGADGSAFGVVDTPAPTGTTIECIACHNEAILQHNSVMFPSGLEITGLVEQAVCLDCHQGLTSKISVDAIILEAIGDDLDAVSEDLAFIDIHNAAADTRYGTEVMSGYEYEGLEYDPRFDHVEGYQSCIGCHDMHTLELKVEECAACHAGVASLEDVRAIRFTGSLNDYDGDGNLEEPIRDEIAGLQELLYASMQAYAEEVAGTPLVYDAASYPYFFDEAGEEFSAWTGRLVRATYNYQVSLKDPGAFTHGGKYIIQLLYDSIADLNGQISTPVDMSVLNREDAGHFAASGEPWRHWDENDPKQVPASCSKCHSAEGLPTFITTGGDSYPQTVTSGLHCTSCHDNLSTFSRYVSEQVTFPSGATVTFENLDANLCLNCHQGRESKASVDAAITQAGVDDDEVSESLFSRNPHYFAAGATLWGTEVQGAYEYDGRTYNSRFLHVPGYQTCNECHGTHGLEVQVKECGTCHGANSEGELHDIRITDFDFDGDGDISTGIAVEVMNVNQHLYAAIQAYALEVTGSPIAFNAAFYPYWFIDTDENGHADPDESNPDNTYTSWTPRLLRAAYNYTWTLKDPGSYAHNGQYILQVLYDSLQDIGADVTGLIRPEVIQ
jgi:hypothetical protein